MSHPSVRCVLFLTLVLPLFGCETLSDLLSSAPKPTARITDARFTGLSLDQVELDLDVEVDNPYGVDLPIAGIDLALSSNDNRVLAASVEPGAPIPAEGSRRLPVPVSIPFLEVVEVVAGLEPGGTTPYRVDLTLAFDTPVVGRVDVPLRHAGDLWVPALPAVRVARIGMTELSVTRVRAEVAIGVESDNAVELPIERFDYGLQLAGVPVARSTLAPDAALPADGRAELVIPIDVNPLSTGRALVQALSAGRVDYAVDGGLELGTPLGPWSVPVSVSGSAPLVSSD